MKERGLTDGDDGKRAWGRMDEATIFQTRGEALGAFKEWRDRPVKKADARPAATEDTSTDP